MRLQALLSRFSIETQTAVPAGEKNTLLEALENIPILTLPPSSQVTFTVEGIPFFARNITEKDKPYLEIWSTLGYLPYSIQDREKRRALATILYATKALKGVHFGVDSSLRIIVKERFALSNPPPPYALFEALVSFLQKARPYIRLIGAHL
ncbi:MAG: hypothetical protein FWF24_01310 [Alphaproteobacteria bacterium]|nr:hypothetical protein [Alphaproteobacteria bacterium]